MDREYAEMVEKELGAVGLKAEIVYGGKHSFARWTSPGGEARSFTCPNSGSDWRGVHNSRADLRRILRDDGLIDCDFISSVPAAIPVFPRDGIAYCTSLDIARAFEKEHKNVLNAIDNIAAKTGHEFNRLNLKPIGYLDPRGREQRAFELSRDGFSLVVMGFTGNAAMQWKLRFLEAFNAMERELTSPALRERIAWLEGELKAVSDLLLELPAPKAPEIIVVKKQPWIARRSVLRKQMRRRA